MGGGCGSRGELASTLCVSRLQSDMTRLPLRTYECQQTSLPTPTSTNDQECRGLLRGSFAVEVVVDQCRQRQSRESGDEDGRPGG